MDQTQEQGRERIESEGKGKTTQEPEKREGQVVLFPGRDEKREGETEEGSPLNERPILRSNEGTEPTNSKQNKIPNPDDGHVCIQSVHQRRA